MFSIIKFYEEKQSKNLSSFIEGTCKQYMSFRKCVHCGREYESLINDSTCSSYCAKEIGKQMKYRSKKRNLRLELSSDYVFATDFLH